MTGEACTDDACSLAGITTSLAGLGYELRRAWPRSHDHLLLDLHSVGRPKEDTVAGQWFRDPGRARSTADTTPGATGSGRLVIQPAGADRRLTWLASLLSDPLTDLVSHRPERRAVLRHRARGDSSYTKVVAVKKHRALERAARIAATLPLRTPQVRSTDAARGTVTTQALPGRTLHDLLAGPEAEAACFTTGAALAALHRITPPVALSVHTVVDEQNVARSWRHFAATFKALSVPGKDEDVVLERRSNPSAMTLIHRDFHDKQVLVADDASIGILDFDLMAVGEPALDLANILVHIDLRRTQGLVNDAGPLRHALLCGYEPSEKVAARLPGYEALARRRLDAVYAFRPSGCIT